MASAALVRPLVGALPDSPRGIAAMRRLVAGVLAVAGPADPAVRIERVYEPAPGGLRVRGEWLRGDGSGPRGAMLWVHGSAFAVASARTHRGLTSRVARHTGLPVFACDYRLAPRHRLDAAVDDVATAFDMLCARGYAPGEIVVGGDSAGGFLALEHAVTRRRRDLPGPAALVLLSPLVDPTLATARARDDVRPDPMISAGRAERLVRLSFGAAPPAAFTAADLVGLPPTLVQVGGGEALAADAELLTARMRDAGTRCELQVWPEQVHVFQALPRLVPEAGAALADAAAFARGALDGDGGRPSATPDPSGARS